MARYSHSTKKMTYLKALKCKFPELTTTKEIYPSLLMLVEAAEVEQDTFVQSNLHL